MKKNKILSLICAAAIAVSLLNGLCVYAASNGNGTVSDPYKISSLLDFLNIEKNPSANYILMDDIYIDIPFNITSFSGTFDGNGHRILINQGPLFKEVSGTVKNLCVDGNITSSKTAGMIAGTLTGTISECSTTGSISGKISTSSDTNVSESESDENSGENSNTSLEASIGGIAGVVDGGTISDCFSNISINSELKYCGGIAGYTADAEILNCYTYSQIISKSSATGAVVGQSENSQITNCYYEDRASLSFGVGVGSDTTTHLSYDEMQSAQSFKGFDFNDTWTIIEGKTMPMLVSYNGLGTAENPFKIHDYKDTKIVHAACSDKDKHYELVADISDYFNIIGTPESPFMGHFNGNGHVITTSSIMVKQEYDGIFSVVGEGALVENLTCINTSVYFPSVAGGIAAINYGTIEGCSVFGVFDSSKDCGGIAGENIGGTIRDCYFNGSIGVTSSGGGGIAGYNSYGTIENCDAVITSYDYYPYRRRGIGGIAGDNSYGVIKNCRASGNISAKSEIGGIAGRLYNGSILSSYSTCSISGSEKMGGIYGTKIEDGYVENSYYQINEEKPLDEAQKNSYGKTAEQMKLLSTYSGFDFDSVWTVNADGMPVIKSITGSGTKTDPYIIRTADDFLNIKLGRKLYYKLANDINGALQLTPSDDPFIGCFDGNGHKIDTSSTVVFKDIGEGAYIGNLHTNTSLAYNAKGATIEYCSVKGTEFLDEADNCTIKNSGVYYNDSSNSGFINKISGGKVLDCFVKISELKGSKLIGGFTGQCSNAEITNCYVEDSYVSSSGTSGGFVGRCDNNSKITNCFTNATVDKGEYSGLFAGMNYAQIDSCYALGSSGSEEEKLEFVSYDDGQITNCGTEYDGNPFKIIYTGGIGISVDIPDIGQDVPNTGENISQNPSLSDISGHWAEQTIINLVNKNIISGYEDGTFRPQNSITKGEFIKLLIAANKTSLKSGFTSYEDVNKHWAKDYIYTAVMLGICDNINVSNSEFGVDKAITRAEAAALTGRLISPDISGTTTFTDSSAIPDWAQNPVYACVEKGIITGMDDGSFSPANNLTRAEAATIIERITNLNN